MKKIKLNKGYAIVDDEDYGRLVHIKWHLNSHGYAVNRMKKTHNGKNVTIRMHRLVMDTPQGQEVHHRNGDPLDNRKANLLNCDHAENMALFVKMHKDNKLGEKNISYSKRLNKYRVRLQRYKKEIYLGVFKTLEEAKRARDQYVSVNDRSS